MAKRSSGQSQRRTKPKHAAGMETDDHGREVLNVSALMPSSRVLKLDVVQANKDDENDVVVHREVPFDIPGSMPMEVMLKMVEFNRLMTDPNVTSNALAPALYDANQLIEQVIRGERANQDKPMPTRRTLDGKIVAASFGLNEYQIMGIIAFLVGNSSVTQALIDLLSDQRDGEQPTAADAVKDTEERSADGAGVDGPLGPSKRRSSSRSSTSRSTTAGKPSGGSTARGRRSAATSAT